MITRRNILRSAVLLGGATTLGSATVFSQESKPATDVDSDLIYSTMLGWKIGPHCYSFRLFPFDVAIKKCVAVGARSFEISSGQKLVAGREVKTNLNMSKSDLKLFRKILVDNSCTPHVMGICPAERKHFDFAAELGVSVLNTEAPFERLEEINQLADEYKINVALHNHPKPSIYWNPDIILERLKNCGSRMGACCDTGHWVRSGLDPVECIKKLGNRIFSFHIKDINEKHIDVPLGSGICQIADVLKTTALQHIRAVFSVEYESSWENNVPQIAEGIRFFHQTAKEIMLS
ncbi:MAG: sugar phosphate isomerase/epimerase [Planctomycetaceae bacterium]|jgi:sugar phosphate isomerase/epimerase|nr:sugar phosphate isomerase/epimerase [Planctomycetaceae bacterium]